MNLSIGQTRASEAIVKLSRKFCIDRRQYSVFFECRVLVTKNLISKAEMVMGQGVIRLQPNRPL